MNDLKPPLFAAGEVLLDLAVLVVLVLVVVLQAPALFHDGLQVPLHVERLLPRLRLAVLRLSYGELRPAVLLGEGLHLGLHRVVGGFHRALRR